MTYMLALLLFIVSGGPYTQYIPLVPFDYQEPRTGVGGAPCSKAHLVGATWSYYWSPGMPTCEEDIDLVPMFKEPQVVLPPEASLPRSRYLLVGNENDLVRTAPHAMAQFWRAIEIAYPERLLVGVNVSHHGVDYQLEWIMEYVRQYGTRPRIHALGVHCYGLLPKCQIVIQAMLDLAQTWSTSGKIWLTEFSTPFWSMYSGGGEDVQLVESRKYLEWVHAQPEIARYAWFMWDMRLDEEWGIFYPDDLWHTGLYRYDALTPMGEMFHEVVAQP